MTALSIRPARPDELDALVALINLAFLPERAFVAGDRLDGAEAAALWRAGEFLVAERAGAVIGCVYVQIAGARGYFGLLAVAPAAQGGGVGRQLVAAAEARCRGAGCTAMDLKIVDLRPELGPLYHKLGYVADGSAPFESPQLLRPARFIKMTKPL